MRCVYSDNSFKEALEVFHPEKCKKLNSHMSNFYNNSSDLLFDFQLKEDWNFAGFTIKKSMEVCHNVDDGIGQECVKSFVSSVSVPDWVRNDFHHLFSLGLSAVCSFCIDRPVFTSKNNDLQNLLFPVLTRGIGATQYEIHPDILNEWKKRLDETLNILFKLDFESTGKENEKLDYKKIMQVMRLIQLAHQNHKEDFNLSYSLLVSGIEAIAQIAISKKHITKHKDYDEWEKLSKKNEFIKTLFDEYKNNRFLGKRFTKFIFDHCPVAEWKILSDDEIIWGFSNKSPHKLAGNYIRSMQELPPNHFTEKELGKIIKNTYNYRSKFFHEGQPTPHNRTRNNPMDRFFEKIIDQKKLEKFHENLKKEGENEYNHKDVEHTESYVIKYDLLTTIARKSISDYLYKSVHLREDF